MSGIEILGIAAAVLQIADLGGKLSVKLFTFSRKIKSADKTINSISQDIAATGAVLQQLASVLKKDEKLRLCSDQAIETAKGLVADCKKIFSELDEALDNHRTSGNKIISGWMDRLKYPFIEPQIELLQSNLERLKSSLVVMLNVLIYAEQLRNHEALPILKEQRTLIQILVDDRNSSCKKFDQLQKAIEDKPNSTREISIELSPRSQQRGKSPPVFSLTSIKANPSGRELEIEHHGTLVENLMNEINASRYRINHGIRYRMHQGVLRAHWEEWSPLRKRIGHGELMKTISLHTEVNQYWLSRLETEGVIEDNASRSDRPSSSTQSVEPSDKNVYGTKFCQTISSRNFVNAKADLPPYESETIFTKPNSQERPSARPDRSPKLSAQFISPGSVHRIHSRDKTEHEGWSDLQQIPQKHTIEIPPSIVARPFAERHVLPPPPPPPPLPNLTRPITKPPAFLPPPPPRPSGFSSYLPYPPAPGAPLPSNPTYIPTPGVPVAGFSPGISPWQPSPGLHDVRSRGAVTLPQEEQRLGSTNTHSLRRTPSSGSDSAITASEGPRRSNLASQWPLERVTSWLISNSFSDGWVTTFKNLKIEGSEVVDLGVGRNGRGNVAMMHQRIYPELARVCTRNGILWDQAREREEGKRLRRLLARDMKLSDKKRNREEGLPDKTPLLSISTSEPQGSAAVDFSNKVGASGSRNTGDPLASFQDRKPILDSKKAHLEMLRARRLRHGTTQGATVDDVVDSLTSQVHRSPSPPSRESFGWSQEFKASDVAFHTSHHALDSSDDDSEDGLFKVPISNRSITNSTPREKVTFDSRPSLSVARQETDDAPTTQVDQSWDRASFDGSIWAVRAPVDDILENMSAAFPKLSIGSILEHRTGRPIVGRILGKGKGSLVYLGLKVDPAQLLIIKQIRVSSDKSAGAKQEIDRLGRLSHPNLVQYLGCDQDQDHACLNIHLQYVSGGSIGTCLRAHGKLEEAVIRSVTSQTLAGLCYLHNADFVHGNMKADNMLLDLNGVCKLCDFGITRKYDKDSGNSIIVPTEGTKAEDIWSLGTMVLEMYSGRRALGAETNVELSLKMTPTIPEDVTLRASVDGLAFILDCFTIDPDERPTADTLVQHSPFCALDQLYDFRKTNLFARLAGEQDVNPRHNDTNTLSISDPQQHSGGPIPEIDFASEEDAIRQPKEDEHMVMKYFTRHASRCSICKDPYEAYTQGIPLCSRGDALAKDLALYIYANEGKPYSVSDRKRGKQIQIQIPVGMEVISLLIKAIDRGLSLTQRKKLIINQDSGQERSRRHEVEIVEITPVSTRRDRKEKVPETRQRNYQRDGKASLETPTKSPGPLEPRYTTPARGAYESPSRHAIEMEPGLVQRSEPRKELAQSFKGSRIRRGTRQRKTGLEVLSSESETGDERYPRTIPSPASSSVDGTGGVVSKYICEREATVEPVGEDDDIDALLLEWTNLSAAEVKG